MNSDTQLSTGLIGISRTISAALTTAESDPQNAPAGVIQFLERGRRFAELAQRLNWPPPWHLPARTIDAITRENAAGGLSDAEVEAAFLDFYKTAQVREFLSGWQNYEWLSHRMSILRDGVLSHLEGRYFSAVCTLLPQIEGMLWDLMGKKPNPKNNADLMFRESRLGRIAKDFYVDIILEGVDWQRTAVIPELSRHAILHGRATDYGTLQNSIKVLIIVDIVISGIAERRAVEDDSDGEEKIADQE